MADIVLSPYDRDIVARTLIGEAGDQGPEGMAAVANVVKNRVKAGFAPSAAGVALARGQFEPWGNPATATRLSNIDPGSPAYQQAASIADDVFGSKTPDNTNGATHFFAPQLQAQLGRNAPSWAASFTPTAQIGGHNFYQDPKYAGAVPSTGGTMQIQGPQQGQPQLNPTALPQVQQQTIGGLQNDAPYLQKLADSLTANAQQTGKNAHTPWEALGSILESAVGNYKQQQAKDADKDYVTKLAAALSGGDRGQLATALLANPDTRGAGFSLLAAPKPQADIKPIGTDYLGNTQYGKVYPDGRIEKIDPNALNAAGAQPGQPGQAAATPSKTLTPDMKGQAVLDALPPAIASKVRNVISGDDVLNPREKDYPQMSTLAYQADPTFSRTDANIRYKYKQDFMDPKGKVGTVRVAMNNALGHASDAYDLSQNFPDTGFKLANRVGNWWSDQTNDPNMSKYQTVTTALAGEMARVASGGDTAEADRKAWLDKFDPSRGPTALKAAFSEAGSILNSKLQSLKHDWTSNMGANSIPPNVLAAPSADMMKKLGVGDAASQAADQTVSKTQPAQAGKVLRYNPQTGGLE